MTKQSKRLLHFFSLTSNQSLLKYGKDCEIETIFVKIKKCCALYFSLSSTHPRKSDKKTFKFTACGFTIQKQSRKVRYILCILFLLQALSASINIFFFKITFYSCNFNIPFLFGFLPSLSQPSSP